MHDTHEQSFLPDYVLNEGKVISDTAVVCDSSGRIVRLAPAADAPNVTRLPNRALFPGLVNAHSHAFQRVIRGRTEYRSAHGTDSFWTWRELMYAAANKLDADDIYATSRMAFMEMALSGITAVGEFHYIHHAPGGKQYSDPNLLEKAVIRAAYDVGLRIALLRVAYVRAGYELEPNPLQIRFIEDSSETYLKNLENLVDDLAAYGDKAWAGIAPHSVRAVPLDYLKRIVQFGGERGLPVHMHVAEQPAEVSACIQEYQRSPIALLDTEGLLSERFTAIHAIHVTPKAIQAIEQAHSLVCACPTTERNLGDGVVPVDAYFKAGVRVSLGSDSQTQIDLLEDARELEYHLRLQRSERNVLAPAGEHDVSGLARRLFECATLNGAASIGFAGGRLEAGSPADFLTVDLDDASVAGASAHDLLPTIVFSLSRTAVRDVFVSGQRIVEDGRHAKQDEIVAEFKRVQRNLWAS